MRNPAIIAMLEKYQCETTKEYCNALKEIVQEVALLGLWRSKFFDSAAFYGGTALRILYKLDRFSEDLDFSLLKQDKNFPWSKHLDYVRQELASFGFEVAITEKEKKHNSAVRSAFLKSNTKELFLVTQAAPLLQKSLHSDQQIKIKLEIDTDPPPFFTTSIHYLLQPIPFAVRTFSKEDLFAGKMHALLCRQWKNRVKGRDWYDMVWYLQNHIPLNLTHLEARMRQSGHYKMDTPFNKEKLRSYYLDVVARVNFTQAKQDILPFINNQEVLDLWSVTFFETLADAIVASAL